MKGPLTFHQAIIAVVKRAQARHQQATGKFLSLQTIAHNVGINVTTLALVLSGEAMFTLTDLLPLLVYLGCDEQEQRFIFHLAELTLNNMQGVFVDPNTEEHPLRLFSVRGDTDPSVERITEEHPQP
jgi:hypothetical protein